MNQLTTTTKPTLVEIINAEKSKLSISSKAIAEETGKHHNHVIRDIKNMRAELIGDDPKLDHEQIQGLTEVFDVRGYTAEILLSEEMALTLILGYRADLRLKVIRRWKELEDFVITQHELLLNGQLDAMLRNSAEIIQRGQQMGLTLDSLRAENYALATELGAAQHQNEIMTRNHSREIACYGQVSQNFRPLLHTIRDIMLAARRAHARLKGDRWVYITSAQRGKPDGYTIWKLGFAKELELRFTSHRRNLKGAGWEMGEVIALAQHRAADAAAIEAGAHFILGAPFNTLNTIVDGWKLEAFRGKNRSDMEEAYRLAEATLRNLNPDPEA